MKSDNWEKPRLWQGQRLRGKSGNKSNILSAKLDRQRRRKVLEGYPVDSFLMNTEELNRYFSGEFIVCLLCGKKYRTLGGPHLQKVHGMTEDQYRERYGIAYSQGLSCGDLLAIRAEQGKGKVDNLRPYDGTAHRKKGRVSNVARQARKSNIKKASECRVAIKNSKIAPMEDRV